MKDVRFGFRMLLRTPMLSLIATLTFGLGAGSTAFIYMTTAGIAELPVANADRLLQVVRGQPGRSYSRLYFSEYRDLRERQTSFEDLAAYYPGTMNLAGQGEPPQRIQGGYVTANAFDGLGVSPLLGRAFQEDDDLPGAPGLLLLGFDIWTNRFGADAEVVGQSALLNGEPATIIGVMPQGFGFPQIEVAWTTLHYDPITLPRRGGNRLFVWGYLREGRSRAAATAELQALMTQREAEFPALDELLSVRAVGYVDASLPSAALIVRNLMFLMVAGVLLVACANVTNLLLARATARQREVAVRTALGASRLRVIRQLLVEAMVIGLAGGALGLIINLFAVRWFVVTLADVVMPFWVDFSLDWPVLLFTATVTLVAGLLAGTIPALRASGTTPGTMLNDESRGSSSLRMGRFGTGLVVVELAISCALMIASGLVVRSVTSLKQTDPGFETAYITTGRLALFATDYPEPQERNRFYHDVLERIASDPATDAVALTSHLPGVGQTTWRVRVEGDAYPLPEDVPETGGALITPGFFEMFGIRILEGRDLLMSESMWGGEPVAIVSEGFVRRHMEGRSALGSRIRVGSTPDPTAPWARIVGVVPDTYQGMGRWGADEQLKELVYLPLAAAHPSAIRLAVRARDLQPVQTTLLREAIAEIDPTLPLHSVKTMTDAVAEADFLREVVGMMASFFSVVALFLATVGLYGVIDFSVSSRLRETGVRVALGADRPRIIGLVLGRVLRQLGLGLLIGVAAGFLLAKPMAAALIGIATWDPVVYGLVILTLTATALLAAVVPTLKAIRVDPAEALRAD